MQRRRLVGASAGAFVGALAAGLVPGSGRAQELEVLQLRHRRAEELLPLLQPLVEPGGALTGTGYQLILRASPAHRNQLKQLIAQLDTRPQQLVITVRQEREQQRQAAGAGIDGGVVITERGVVASGRAEAGNQRSVGTREVEQRVQVLEGARVRIAMGTAVPLRFNRYVLSARGVTEVQGTVLYEAVTGFVARPMLAGGEVTIELSPEDAQLNAPAVERSQLSTTVRGRLGQWIAVGGADLREQRQNSGGLQHAERAQGDQRGVWLKVDLAN